MNSEGSVGNLLLSATVGAAFPSDWDFLVPFRTHAPRPAAAWNRTAPEMFPYTQPYLHKCHDSDASAEESRAFLIDSSIRFFESEIVD
jgi:hypothetical protein